MWHEKAWLDNGPVPARDIHRGRHGRNTIYFPSIKNGTQVICESALEASYCVWLEWDSDVKAYYAQPHTFKWKSGGASLHYTPDFFVIHHTGANHFTEVKPDFLRTTRHNLTTLEAFTELCEQWSIQFKKADARQILQPVRLANLKWLYSRLHLISAFEIDYCAQFLAQLNQPITWGKCLSVEHPPSVRAVARAIFNGEVIVDLNQPLTQATLLKKRPIL